MVLLSLSEAKYLKKYEGKSIYELDGRYYVGVEALVNYECDIENSIACNSMEEAEAICTRLNREKNEFP